MIILFIFETNHRSLAFEMMVELEMYGNVPTKKCYYEQTQNKF